jgi:hypothetical protein
MGRRLKPRIPHENGGRLSKVLGKNPKFDLGKAVAGLFQCARTEAKPLGHHRQIATEFRVAFLDLVAEFAAFKCSQQGIGNAPPGRRLP